MIHARAEKIILIVLIVFYQVSAQTLAKVNLSNIISYGIGIHSSGIGLTYDFPTLIPYLTDPLLIGYLNNAGVYQDSDYFFWQNIHCPIGYKYGCRSSLYGGASVNCTVDISSNYTLYSNMNYFFEQVGQFWAVNMGWDMEKANFSNMNYAINMGNYYYNIQGNFVNVELVDKGDQLANYSAAQLVSDASTISSWTFYLVYIMAPGLTEDNTDDAWWNSIPTFTYNMGIFTLRCVIFKNSADVTIANLMNDTYVDTYIKNRLTQPNGTYNDPYLYPIALSDIRLTNTTGVDGVTNSFAAALWALDFSLKYMSIGGYFASFYTPFTSSNQSVLGASPYFGPQALYYGLLFANYAISKYSSFITPNTTAVSSQFIKIYAFQYSQGTRVVLINKDLNSSSNGTVDILLDQDVGLTCTYMEADNLTSTSGITIGNVSFVANSSDFVGGWNNYQITADENAVFHVPLRYAQAAICNTVPKTTFNYFPRRSSLSSHQLWHCLSLAMLALLAMF